MSLRRPTTTLLIAAGVALALVRVGRAAPEDSFLDQPLPKILPARRRSLPSAAGEGPIKEADMVPVTSFWNGVQLLGTLAGKPVRLPAELTGWPDERTEKNWSLGLGVLEDGKVRGFFQQLCLHLHVDWRYDAAAGVIDLQPAWRRDDPRSGKELIGLLLGTRPAAVRDLERDPAPNRVGGHGLLRDPWRLAFDALLSRPENFALAGALRLCHDSHGSSTGMFLGFVENLCAARISDADGRSRVVVLNRQVGFSNKGSAGDVAYYFFDEEGRFLQGGIYAVAPRCVGAITAGGVDAERTVTATFGRGTFAGDKVQLHFALKDGDLVLQGSTDTGGKERSAEETQGLLGPQFNPLVRQEYRFPAR